jgi:hypothetical protein
LHLLHHYDDHRLHVELDFESVVRASEEEIMVEGYRVVCYRSISNPAARETYSKLAVPAVVAAGGRFLAIGAL